MIIPEQFQVKPFRQETYLINGVSGKVNLPIFTPLFLLLKSMSTPS